MNKVQAIERELEQHVKESELQKAEEDKKRSDEKNKLIKQCETKLQKLKDQFRTEMHSMQMKH